MRVWLWGLQGLAVDPAGNVFFPEVVGARVRKLTPSGQVITIAGAYLKVGQADGTGADARFERPATIAIDPAGTLYIGSWGESPREIRKVSPTGEVSTLAGVAPSDPWNQTKSGIWALAVEASGDLLVADGGPRLWAVAPDGSVRARAGNETAGWEDGPLWAAQFRGIVGLAVDATGNVYVADPNNNRIRKIDTAGQVSTLAGGDATGSVDGERGVATLFAPMCLAIDPGGSVLFSSPQMPKIRRVSPDGRVSTLAGGDTKGYADGAGAAARFEFPIGLAVTASGDVLVAESSSKIPRIRRVTPDGQVSTVAGTPLASIADGPVATARFSGPVSVAADAAGNLYVLEINGYRIRKIDTAGSVTTLAGSGEEGFADGPGAAAKFGVCKGLAVDAGGTVYVADFGNNRVRKVDPAGRVSTLAGSGESEFADGTGADAGLQPQDVAVDERGAVYVTDLRNNRIRKIDPAGRVTTLAGSGTRGRRDGPAATAQFEQLTGIAVDTRGYVYAADFAENRSWVGIRKISPCGEVSSVAGGPQGLADGYGGTGRFGYPGGLAVDGAGTLYVADHGNRRIRRVDPSGAVTTLAGGGPAEGEGDPGFADGIGTAARFNFPADVALAPDGRLFVADANERVIRAIR